MEKHIFVIEGRSASLYSSKNAASPLLILNVYSDDVDAVTAVIMKEICKDNGFDFHLLVIHQLRWEHDMTPWPCPPVAKNDPACTGGADEYLKILTTQIIPQAKSIIHGEPAYIGMVGYSLAGLFALYAIYKSDIFDCVASVSGSLWFPEFKDYVMNHAFCKRPKRIYISLGNREAYTKNAYLKSVQTNSEDMVEHYRSLGVDVIWEINQGNHFKDVEVRIAKGMRALL